MNVLVRGLLAAVVLTAGAALIPGSESSSAPAAPVVAIGTNGSTPGSIPALQARLKRLPKDDGAWAALGAAYVQHARVTGDPSFYPKAEQAVERSLALKPGNFAGLTGQAALAAGRHDFSAAVRLADQAVAVNPYGPVAYGVLADAHTQLGDYEQATRAITRMMELAPGVSSFTRASYDAEIHGDQTTARRMLEYALRDAYLPGDVAFCQHYLGELALLSGDLDRAREHYRQARAADPRFLPAQAGLARVSALTGNLTDAADRYADVTGRLPLTQYLVEYGEVLEKLGRDPAPQWRLLTAQRDLMRANGVHDDITWAEFEADHGDPATAVEYARAEYARNPNVVAADALAWALHRDGRSRDALPYAKKAAATGWRNALFAHHRAEIERALDLPADAAALVKKYNPRFDPKLPALQRFS
ncbi:tetratricopeptide repeat protein [Acrocarpospora corrugata]|uniref:tetratricopeptide repeat protein n=1 Tax=Acrocarpospora corrugata TaxID=35763 RepID=UPI00147913A0|nr:tetratricopeptide repeat protein [Acrocarpospora corrugata]